MKLPRLLCMYMACAMCVGFSCAAPVPAPTAVLEPARIPALKSALASSRPLLTVTNAGSRMICVGQMGHILYSDDKGRAWTQATVPVSVDLTSVFFATSQVGWATGHDGVVLKTSDGGKTWTLVLEGRQAAKLLVDYYSAQDRAGNPAMAAALVESKRYLKEDGARPFLDVWFKDEKSGFVIGAWGLILHTDDGGKTWTPWLERTVNPNADHLNAIRFVDGQLWIVGDQGVLLRLDETAQRFVSSLPPEGGSLFGVTGKPGVVLAYGLIGRTLVSRDGGKTWAKGGAAGGSGITSGTVLADGSIVLVDTGARIWISRDDGKSFSSLRMDTPMSYFGVVAADAQTLVLVGSSGVRQQIISHH